MARYLHKYPVSHSEFYAHIQDKIISTEFRPEGDGLLLSIMYSIL